jgi:UrcA family protein
MKTLSLTLLLVSSFGMAAAPALARTGEKVAFKYRPSELETVQSRDALLDRLQATSKVQCQNSLSMFYSNIEKCTADLEGQYIKAIGNPALIAQYSDDDLRIASSGL